MSKKDYELIASIISRVHGLSEADRRALARCFASELLNTNPRFNMKRFLQACEVVHAS